VDVVVDVVADDGSAKACWMIRKLDDEGAWGAGVGGGYRKEQHACHE
jgi:hypothetical protein